MGALHEEMAAAAIEAQKLTRKYFVAELDFSPDSVESVDQLCDDVDFAMPGGRSEENIERLTRCWGAYLGEVIRRGRDGRWIAGPLLQVGDTTLDPLAQVRRRLVEGDQHRLMRLAKGLD